MSISTIRRQVKNVAYNFSDAQVKVREATSNDPWGPSTALMSEIADLTHNPMAFTEIMSIVWKRLNDSGKNWRHVYKSLVLLDFLIKCGHEKVMVFWLICIIDFFSHCRSRNNAERTCSPLKHSRISSMWKTIGIRAWTFERKQSRSLHCSPTMNAWKTKEHASSSQETNSSKTIQDRLERKVVAAIVIMSPTRLLVRYKYHIEIAARILPHNNSAQLNFFRPRVRRCSSIYRHRGRDAASNCSCSFTRGMRKGRRDAQERWCSPSNGSGRVAKGLFRNPPYSVFPLTPYSFRMPIASQRPSKVPWAADN